MFGASLYGRWKYRAQHLSVTATEIADEHLAGEDAQSCGSVAAWLRDASRRYGNATGVPARLP